ncbi:MAG TPA: restriction endonuclease subunit S [Candidatus Baltobacteraceae bacterium]|nr:restriction endonuclease subunit S [Candidatus Baltobacteraceae bacterium]
MIAPFPVDKFVQPRKGWVIKPLWSLLSANDGGVWGDEPRLDGSDTLVLRSTEQTVNGKWAIEDPMPRALSAREKHDALLREGDLLVTKSSGSDLHIGKTTIVDRDISRNGYCYSNFMQRLRTNANLRPQFLYWVLNSAFGRGQMSYLSNTTTGLGNLNAGILNSMRILVPDTDTQSAVVAFLDQQTSIVDALISDFEQLIALLEEKRSTTITLAVTKGFNRSAGMRDSGIPWIGEIPAHWEVVRFKYCAQVSEGQVDPRDARFADAILLAPNHIESNTGRWLHREKSSEQSAISGKYVVRKGDVVYSKIRPALNKATISDIQCLCSADMYTMRPSRRMTSRFLLYTILSKPFVALASEISMRVAMPKVNRASLAIIPMAVPPIDEQESIAHILENQLAVIDSEIDESRNSLSLAREYRTAIITTAITGGLDAANHKVGFAMEVA